MNEIVDAMHVNITRGGKKILRDLTFSIKDGTITGFVGPSGSGKTTLMRAIVGVQLFDGPMSVLGQPAGDKANRGRIGYMTQSASVYESLTVRQNLQYFADLTGTDGVEETISFLDMEPQADQKVSTLSGGQRNRVSLGCALVMKAPLLVLDEPTVGLDPLTRERIWDKLRELKDSGTNIIISTHVMDEAARCDDILLLRDGRILAHSTPKALLETSRTDNLDAAFLELIKREEKGI